MYEVIQGGVTAAKGFMAAFTACLLYTSDAADEL